MIHNFSKHPSVINSFLAQLRSKDQQLDSLRFRRNLERIGELIAYEISKTFEYTSHEVETPLGVAETKLPTNRVVLATVLRAGLPLHQGLLNVFDSAECAFISAYRRHHKSGDFEIEIEYISCPDLTGCTLIVCDAMLATGASITLATKALLEHGEPAHIHLVSAIASATGLDYTRRLYPKASYWIGAVDEELTAKSYIVPGLGDAGDLCYGTKLQE